MAWPVLEAGWANAYRALRKTCLSRFTFRSFSTVSRHLRRDLEQARLVIGFIAPLGTQVRRLVIFKLLRPVSFYF